MIFWICGTITLLAAASAACLGDLKKAILALWVTGLAIGGVYLSVGAELIAVVQWIISTLVAISFIFYAVMFGEYGVGDSRSFSSKLLSSLLPILVGGAFAAMLWMGVRETALKSIRAAEVEAGTSETLGMLMAGHHFLSLELLGLTLFLTIVGAGVIARPEEKDT